MQDFWLDAMKSTPNRLEPTYSRKLQSLEQPKDPSDPVTVVLERTDDDHIGQTETVRARYVVGCDGARSLVRKSLGLQLKGDSQNQAWGVLDALVVTTFPDVRLKTAIHSASAGSILIIPREGGYLVRFYIELDKLQANERVAEKKITQEVLIAKAKEIFHPFTFDVKEVAHWSVYEVGQRLTDHFDDVPLSEREFRNPRIFITGDACHTHSAKAGQGMNVSMNDSFNLGWKLAAVLRGQAEPGLLHTYSEERQAIAQMLIDFDREMSRMFAAKPKGKSSTDSTSNDDEVDPAIFQAFFEKQGRFTAGLETKYHPSSITSADTAHQHLASGFEIGTRFHSFPVLRVSDAKAVQLGHVMDADGRWRIVIFSDQSDSTSASSPIAKLCHWLQTTLIPRYTPFDNDVDSILDVRAVLQQSRKTFNITDLPPLLLPAKGRLGLQDYEKVFTDEESYGWGGGEIYEKRGISREGCVVVVRPDQYVSAVLPLGEEGEKGLEGFFERALRRVG
jgi:phenol 2-monooxygenase